MKQQQRGGYVGTVGKPHRDGRDHTQFIGSAGVGNEARQLTGPQFQIVQIEHALGQTPEEARHPIL
jgi:hypothetical protein